MSLVLQGIDFGPVQCASGARGWFGEGYWYHKYVPGLNWKGSTFVAKTTTLRAREGNMPLNARGGAKEWLPKCVVVKMREGVVLNSVGLSGPGAAALFEMEKWQQIKEPFFLSFMSVADTQERRYNEACGFVEQLLIHECGFSAPFGIQINFSCVAGKTRVLTSEGLVRIDELSDSPTRLLSEWGETRANGLLVTKARKTIKVTTLTGNTIQVTPNHRMKVLNNQGVVEWCEAGDLADGDFLLCRRGHGGMLPEDRGLDSDFWYLVGFLYGDGHRYEHGPLSWGISESKEAIRSLIEQGLESLGVSYSSRKREISNRGGVNRQETEGYILASSSQISDVIPPFERKGAWRRHGVPALLWRQGRSQIAAFLRGIFDADGGVCNKASSVSFSTKYEQLAQDVKALLLLQGVVSLIDYKNAKTRQTPFGKTRIFTQRTVGARSLHEYRRNVGFALPSKTAALDTTISRSNQRPCDKLLGWHHASNLIRRAFPVGVGLGGVGNSKSVYNTISDIRRGKTTFLSETRITAVREHLDIHGVDADVTQMLSNYECNDWWFDEIVSLEPDDVIEVFDITGSKTESYVTNGVVSHNCPNTGHDPNQIAKDAAEILEVFQGVRLELGIPIVPKFNVFYPVEALEAIEPLCDAICISNTIPWGKLPTDINWHKLFDIKSQGKILGLHSPLAHLGGGGLSGAPLLPLVEEWVRTARGSGVTLPINAGGGILGPSDVDVLAKAGANSVFLGSIAILRGWRVRRTIKRAHRVLG